MSKVLVAMSGGVDSSVTAALLKKQGYLVTGGFMKNFSQESWQGIINNNCPWEKDLTDAKKAAEHIGIDFVSFNFEKEYKNRVIDYFFDEFQRGRTPNPDVMCNPQIKFDLFRKEAEKRGFDYIATGHYVRKREVKTNNSKVRSKDGSLRSTDSGLLRGVDKNKDQSYFLYRLNSDQLASSLFPIGGYTKMEIRAKAREFDLPNAEKKDSQGICFVGEVNLKEFLKQKIPVREGRVVTTEGKQVGTHENAAFYTYGQRRGLDLGQGGPFYVVAKDLEKNLVIVTDKHDDKRLYQDTLLIESTNWLITPDENKSYDVQTRYRQKPVGARVEKSDKNKYTIKLEKPLRTPTTGQSAVVYDADVLLGGGIIKKSYTR